MKRIALYFGAAIALAASCSVQEEDFKTPQQGDVIYYASFEQPAEEGTRVYANVDLLLRWTADDRVSIFGMNTYNQQYKFLGETGDNSGGFSKVDGAEYVTGNPISHTVSVYPYQASTKITEDEVLTVTLPAEQHYAENTFGLGANTMVSVSEDNVLMYKNVGGYLMLKLYGDGVSVSSITLKGNNGEKLAGKATVTMPLDGVPSVEMQSEATTEITLTCKHPIVLGSSVENSTDFWFVLPPISFDDGFSIIVKKKDGTAFSKSTSKPITIFRNTISKMSPFEVVIEGSQPNNVIYYTSSDKRIIDPYNNAFNVSLISNEYINGVGVLSFGGDLTSIGEDAFRECSRLTSISLPESLTEIGLYSFWGCSSLSSITIPDGLKSIGDDAFFECTNLSSITVPGSVTSIGDGAFRGCSRITSFSWPENLTTIGNNVFMDCSSLSGFIIPENVTSIGGAAFYGCESLESIIIPDQITSIGDAAFAYSGLTTISIPPSVKSIGLYAFQSCLQLTDVTLLGHIERIEEGTFTNSPKITSIVLPEGVTYIGYAAFGMCSGLTNVTIPNSVTTIDVSAFQDCPHLQSIIIPQNVASIGERAFYRCTSLSRIDVKPSIPPTGGEYMFSETNLCPIYIPAGSEDAYANADYWKRYVLRIMVEGNDSSIAYSSSDYTQDGEVVLLQRATEGRGVNIIFLGDGFVDKDMISGGKYEQKMAEAMEQFFLYEPYYSLRNKFNVYTVKAVSRNDIYEEGIPDMAFTNILENGISLRLDVCKEYAQRVPNPYNQPLKVCTICNTDAYLGRSFCSMRSDGWSCSLILDEMGTVLNHELGGHGFGLLLDEYVENDYTFTDYSLIDGFHLNGMGANVDWQSNPNNVHWAHLLNDPRYSHEGLGVYEGGYLYSSGIYRASENSMMRFNDTPFNAPSREQIYKFIMQYSEGEEWVYDYEEFVKVDERGRKEAAEELGPWKSPQRGSKNRMKESVHCPPIMINENVKEVTINKDGRIAIEY